AKTKPPAKTRPLNNRSARRESAETSRLRVTFLFDCCSGNRFISSPCLLLHELPGCSEFRAAGTRVHFYLFRRRRYRATRQYLHRPASSTCTNRLTRWAIAMSGKSSKFALEYSVLERVETYADKTTTGS